MQIPDIGIIYHQHLDDKLFQSFVESIKEGSLKVAIESREDTAWACPEWFIPAAVVAFIGKSYFDGFLKEMGKDHYQKFKDELSNLSNDVMQKPKIEPFLVGSKGKLSSSNPFSMAFSIQSNCSENRIIKLLVPKANIDIDYSIHTRKFLEFLEDYNLGISTLESIGYSDNKSPMFGRYIFVQYNESKQEIEWLNPEDYK